MHTLCIATFNMHNTQKLYSMAPPKYKFYLQMCIILRRSACSREPVFKQKKKIVANTKKHNL